MKITSKGQVTIPQEIREKHHFYANSNVDFIEDGDRVYVIKSEADTVQESPFDKVKGAFSLKLSTEEIMKLTREDD